MPNIMRSNRFTRPPRRRIAAGAYSSSQPFGGGGGADPRPTAEQLRASNHIGRAEQTFSRLKLDARVRGQAPFCENEFKVIKRLAAVIQLENTKEGLHLNPLDQALRQDLKVIKLAQQRWAEASLISVEKIESIEAAADKRAVAKFRQDMIEATDMHQWLVAKNILMKFVVEKDLPAPIDDLELEEEWQQRKLAQINSATEDCKTATSLRGFDAAIEILKMLCIQNQTPFPFSSSDLKTLEYQLVWKLMFKAVDGSRSPNLNMNQYKGFYQDVIVAAKFLSLPSPISEAEASLSLMKIRLITQEKAKKTVEAASTPGKLKQAIVNYDIEAKSAGFAETTGAERDQYRKNLAEKIKLQTEGSKEPAIFQKAISQINSIADEMELTPLPNWEPELRMRLRLAKLDDLEQEGKRLQQWSEDIYSFENSYQIFTEKLAKEGRTDNPISKSELADLRSKIASRTLTLLQQAAKEPGKSRAELYRLAISISLLKSSYKLDH